MARKTLKLTVHISPAALRKLDEIWSWNAEHRGVVHADAYIAFLLKETNNLSTLFYRGKVIPSFPKLSYRIVRRSKKGHGHLAVFEMINDVIHVLDYFHTAQDWQNALANELQ